MIEVTRVTNPIGEVIRFISSDTSGTGMFGSWLLAGSMREFLVEKKEGKCIVKCISFDNKIGKYVGFLDDGSERDLGDAERNFTFYCIEEIKKIFLPQGEKLEVVE